MRVARVSGLALALLFLVAPQIQALDAAKETPSKASRQTPKVGTKDVAEGGMGQEISSLIAEIKGNPGDAALHTQLGYLLLKKGALDEAKHSFDEGLKLNPRSRAAMTGEGIVLAQQGKLREAERVLKEALVQNPDPVRTHYELGLVYEKLGELDKAIAEYKAAIVKYQQGRK